MSLKGSINGNNPAVSENNYPAEAVKWLMRRKTIKEKGGFLLGAG